MGSLSRPLPAPELVIAPSGQGLNRMNAILPAPNEMKGRTQGTEAQRHHECPMAYETVKTQSEADHDAPLEDLPPGRCLYFKAAKDFGAQKLHREQYAQLELDPHNSSSLKIP